VCCGETRIDVSVYMPTIQGIPNNAANKTHHIATSEAICTYEKRQVP
jgi:hypothetical protein